MDMDEILSGRTEPEPPTPVAPPTGETEAPPPAADAPQEPGAEPAPPAESQQQPPTATERARDEHGRFVKVDDGTPATAPAPGEDSHHVPRAAMLDERRRRQETEARLAQMEAYIASLQQQQQQPPPLTDDNFYAAPLQTTQQIVGQQTQVLQRQIQNYRYEMAEDFTRTRHEDYEAVRDEFIKKYEAQDPWALAVASQMGRMPNPAQFVYDQTKRASVMTDPEAHENRIRADERARVLREVQQQQQQRPAAPNVPRSLNSEPSEVQPAGPQGFGPTPLTNILPQNY
jgi:hypothetical protein